MEIETVGQNCQVSRDNKTDVVVGVVVAFIFIL